MTSLTTRIGREDWLLAAKVALMISIGVILTYAIAVTVNAAIGEPVVVPVSADTVGVADLPAGTELADTATVDVRVDQPTWQQSVLYALTQLPGGVVVGWVFLLLLRVVNQARRCHPFTQGTVRRLRAVGLVLLIGGAVADAVELLAAFALSDTVNAGSVMATYFFTGLWIMAGVGALAIAEVFNRAYAMRAELDEVI
ncbi:MAG TPA: DUF2975 domain-containing protein [Micromonosporaceae bacterium]|nr:DUF2975 domain-containing protein [Micromonosporaceae bacterium]